MTVPAVYSIADQVWGLLDGITGINAFDGVVPNTPAKDPDGTVHAYAVYYPSAGRRTSGRLNAVPGKLTWSFQVTCVGGDRNRCLRCVSKVTTALTGERLDLFDGYSGQIREPGDVGPVRVDRDVAPPRFYLPLLFGVHIAG